MSCWLLTSAHHLLAFQLVATLATELSLCLRGMDGPAIQMLGRIDIAYAIIFVLLLAVRLARAGGTAWPLYRDDPLFWTKLGLVALAGMMSVPPTVAILRWNRSIKRGEKRPCCCWCHLSLPQWRAGCDRCRARPQGHDN